MNNPQRRSGAPRAGSQRVWAPRLAPKRSKSSFAPEIGRGAADWPPSRKRNGIAARREPRAGCPLEASKSTSPHESAEAGPAAETRRRAQEVLDGGVYAALDLCRLARLAGQDYNPFDAFEQRIILLALRGTNGNQLRAARLLGINRSTLRKRMKKHAIVIGTKIVSRK